MSEDNFEKQVELGLNKLNKQQKIEFAWRCAVRALKREAFFISACFLCCSSIALFKREACGILFLGEKEKTNLSL